MPISHLNPPQHVVTRIRQDTIFAGKAVRFLSLGAGRKCGDTYHHELRVLVDDKPVKGLVVAERDGSVKVWEISDE